MDKYCHHCEMTDTDLREGKTERGNCYRDFPATNGTIDVWYGKPACLKFQPTRSWLACQVQELEAQLAAKEQELAEANEAARLQVALDRIEAAGCNVDIRWMFDGEIMYSAELTDSEGECYLYDDFHLTIREAAEAAAAWAESHKEAAHE